ncbi:discoidin domain-containing protein [Microbacterium sp. EST19A]|uniref:discoidin domain-containing protein n=1 Tax=Microbacterium sp. EST19A TaxID=2862681 RepID=UPI001CBF9965|nr:discoidin domain-containing protein [Microbacterium sp. EST19A]
MQLGTKSRPFRTLAQAQKAVRLVNGFMLSDINVRLMDGSYRLSDTLALTARDSGSNGHTITWEAAPGAKPVVSGGVDVTKWIVSDPAKGIWSAKVKDLDARQLYVDGAPATRARSGENPGGFRKIDGGYVISDASMRNWKHQDRIEVASSWGWKLQRCLVESITADRMNMQQPCWHNANLQEGQEIQNPSWIENAYELLDQPGEWYLDTDADLLFYKPVGGKDPNTSEIILPRVESLVDVQGTLAKPVRDIAFSGITFSHSTWMEPSSPDGLIEGQAGFRMVGEGNPTFDSTRLHWKKTPGAVNVGFSRDISFEDSVFTHLGAVGLNLNTGSQKTTIIGNVFTDIAGTGIQIGGTDVVDHHPDDKRQITKDTTVRNNLIHDVATNYRGSVAILAGYTDHTVIEHNRVRDLPYSGISVGWGWGLTDKGGNASYPTNGGITPYTTDTPSRETIVRYNHISDIMRSQADGGAIYTLSRSPESEVSNNLITDIPTHAYGAIYHDESSRYFSNVNNAFCNIAYQWMLINRGFDLDVQRNFSTTERYGNQGGSANTVVTNNTTVPSCEQLPASVVQKAGLEPAYRHLDPQSAPSDTAEPTAPTGVTATAHFPTVADVAWAASTDDVGVTGYSVFVDGELYSASQNPGVRITGLTGGRSYEITVTARDAAANPSAASAAFTLKTPKVDNVAIGKDVNVSSFSEPNVPALAVDGDPSTRWAQGLGLPDPSWYQVDLGAAHDLTGVITTFEKSSGYRYLLETSLDEMHWTTLDDHRGENTASSATYSVPVGIATARFVRLTVTGSSGNGGSIHELEVYGAKSAPQDDTTAPDAPSAPTASVLLPTMLDLSWETPAGDPASYEVWDGDMRLTVTAGTTYRVSGLAPESTHAFHIVARDAVLNSSASSPATTVTMPVEDNFARAAAVTASSFSESNVPANVVDGDPRTRWAQGLFLPDPSWIQLDLGAVKDVSTVASVFELPGGYRYLLESSVDGQSWSVFDDRTAAKTTQRENYSFSAEPVAMRYLRLTVVDSSGNGGSLWEIKAYGGF